jgi:Ca2+-binding EF-hand superfamily protein
MWDDYAQNPDKALEWQQRYMNFMFDLEDASNDGSIDVDEFTTVCSCYGLQPTECKTAFNKMSKVD